MRIRICHLVCSLAETSEKGPRSTTTEETIETLDVVITIAADQIGTRTIGQKGMRTIDQKGLRGKKEKIDRQDKTGRNATPGQNHRRFLKDCQSTELSCMASHMRSGTKR